MLKSLQRVNQAQFRYALGSSAARNTSVIPATHHRYFSSANKEAAQKEDDIFDSASDYFKTEGSSDDILDSVSGGEEANQLASNAADSLPWVDSNDTLCSFMSSLPKDLGNVNLGGSTYGFWEYVSYVDSNCYDLWIGLASDGGLGLGAGLVVTAFLSRLIFVPSTLYGQACGLKMKLMQPDQDKIQATMKEFSKRGQKEAAKLERGKLKHLRKTHGIYPMFSMFNMLQIPVHLVYISMINRLAFNYNIQPGMLTEGFLWFTDLSSPDPTGILPLVGGIVSLMNILSTSTMNTSNVMRKMRRYVYVFPFISVPIWMTFPAAFNIYWLTTASVQLITVNMFRNDWFRRQVCGIPDFLPGTVLEKQNTTKKFRQDNREQEWSEKKKTTTVFANKPKKSKKV